MDSVIEITNVQKDEKTNSLSFDLLGDEVNGLDKAFVNSIRRTLLSSIPTVGFRTDGICDMVIEKNNTSLHNEFLSQRISLIPLYIDPTEYNNDYLFELNVESSDDPILSIYSNDFEIYKKNNDIKNNDNISFNRLNYDMLNPLSSKEKEKIFKPYVNPFTQEKEYCLITELKSTDLKQSLHLYGSPSVAYSYENSKWQAVSKACYNFKKDDKLFKNICKEKFDIESKKNNVEKKDFKLFKKKLDISDSEKYFHKDKTFNPYWYEFNIESQHYHNPKDLLINSIEIIKNNLDIIKLEIESIQNDKDSFIQLKNYNDSTYKILFDGYDDTIGNLIQTYTARYKLTDDSLFSIIGYKKTHPLKKEIVFTLSFNMNHAKFDKNNHEKNLSNIIAFFKDLLNDIIIIYDKILQQVVTKL